MATNITAGNSTNGAAISSDNTGILELKTGTGAGTTAISIDASQQVTLPGNLVVTGTATVGGIPVGGNYILTHYVSPGSWDVNAKKAAGLKAIKVTVVGAGGSGGPATGSSTAPASAGAAGGGGGGGAAIEYLPAPSITPSPTGIAITAGPGTNSFGGFCSATAGANGPSLNQPVAAIVNGAPGAAGGTGSGGTFNMTGGGGGASFHSGLTAGRLGGMGGSSILGGGGAGQATSTGSVDGAPGTNYGGGGSGAVRNSNPGTSNGGTGAPGIVIVEEFY